MCLLICIYIYTTYSLTIILYIYYITIFTVCIYIYISWIFSLLLLCSAVFVVSHFHPVTATKTETAMSTGMSLLKSSYLLGGNIPKVICLAAEALGRLNKHRWKHLKWRKEEQRNWGMVGFRKATECTPLFLGISSHLIYLAKWVYISNQWPKMTKVYIRGATNLWATGPHHRTLPHGDSMNLGST